MCLNLTLRSISEILRLTFRKYRQLECLKHREHVASGNGSSLKKTSLTTSDSSVSRRVLLHPCKCEEIELTSIKLFEARRIFRVSTILPQGIKINEDRHFYLATEFMESNFSV